MTAHPLTLAAARRRAATLTCGCCKRDLIRDDFDPTQFADAPAILALYAPAPVCIDCMDAHVTCRASGVAVKRIDAYRDADGEYYATQALADEADEEAEIWALEKRSMAGWR